MSTVPAQPKVIVIGAGLGGLAVAARLAHLGFSVQVYEAQPGPGGKAGSQTWNGFRFDTGPSLLTLPEVFDELFAACGRRRQDYFEIVPLDPICQYFFADGSRVAAPGTVAGFIDYFSALGWATRRELEAWFRHIKGIYLRAGPIFLKNGLDEFRTWFSWPGLHGLLGAPRLDALRSLDLAVRSHFQDPRLVQLFDRYATYNGSSPQRTPATMGIIPHIEYAMGGWGVKTGIFGITTGLYQLCLDLGVHFEFNSPVRKIVQDRGRVRGIQTKNGRVEFADLLVSNADVLATYQLLDDNQAAWSQKYRRLEPSSSGLVFYWGMNRTWSELDLHNIFFSNDYQLEFKQIFELAQVPDQPTVYVNISSKITPSDAPAGQENWFVLINVPANRGQDWQREAVTVRQRILMRLETALGGPVEAHIEMENILTPLDIEEQTGSSFGSLYGLASNTWNTAFGRHPARVRRHPGLYMVGGSIHPGGGMPLVLNSAAIASAAISRDWAKWLQKRG